MTEVNTAEIRERWLNGVPRVREDLDAPHPLDYEKVIRTLCDEVDQLRKLVTNGDHVAAALRLSLDQARSEAAEWKKVANGI